MAYNKQAENEQENIHQAEAANQFQQRSYKRRAYVLTDTNTEQQIIYISGKISERHLSTTHQCKIFKHIKPPAIPTPTPPPPPPSPSPPPPPSPPLQEATFLSNPSTETATEAAVVAAAAAAGVLFDQATIFASFGSLPIVSQSTENGSITIPETLCTENFLHPDIEYQRDFLIHFRQRERKFRPKPYYLKHQLEIDRTARMILVNWLVSVINENNFDTETLYLTISYIDRFLSRIVLSRNKLQLAGITAVYIAAKYEETRPPGVSKFIFIGGVTFDAKQIVKMERLLLNTLSFDLHVPTSHTFAIAYASLSDVPHILKFLMLYICELSLFEAEPYLQFLPSVLSAASLALARYLLGYPIWSKELEELTSYRIEDLKQTLLSLSKTHFCATKIFTSATKMKFMQEQYHQVALIGPALLNDYVFDDVVHKYNSF